MRERVEDLGRIWVLTENLVAHDFFDLYSGRSKDIHDWWLTLSEEKKEEFLHSFSYGISQVKENLYEISNIARGIEED